MFSDFQLSTARGIHCLTSLHPCSKKSMNQKHYSGPKTQLSLSLIWLTEKKAKDYSHFLHEFKGDCHFDEVFNI
jgi:hypothetical protein